MIKNGGKLRRFAVAVTVLSLIYVTGCASSKKKEEVESGPNSANAEENLSGDSDSGKAQGLHTVHFPYDSSTLSSEAKEILSKNAHFLKSNPNLKIQIEGHCDQRGGIQYNIALGERRAKIAKNYLEDLGIKGDRIAVISFGKEKPVDTGSTDEAYAKNRRDNFVVTTQ